MGHFVGDRTDDTAISASANLLAACHSTNHESARGQRGWTHSKHNIFPVSFNLFKQGTQHTADLVREIALKLESQMHHRIPFQEELTMVVVIFPTKFENATYLLNQTSR